MTETTLFDGYWSQIVGLCFSVFTLVYIYSIYRFNYWRNKGIPQVPGVFPFGSLRKLVLQKVGLVEHFLELYNITEGAYSGFYSFFVPQILIKDLDIIKDVLVKNFNDFVSRGVYINEAVDALSVNMFSIEGDQWRRLRTKLSPTYTSGKMKIMYPTMKECAKELQKYGMKTVAKNGVVDFKDMTMRYSLDVISSTALGLEGNNFVDDNMDMKRIGAISAEPTVTQMIRITFALTCKGLAKLLNLRIVSKEVEKYFFHVVETNTAYREKNNVRRNDFMQLLIDLKNNKLEPEDNSQTDKEVTGNKATLTLNEMVAQSFIFVLAGYETSTVTLCFCLYELALNQHIQDKLIAELDAAGEDISYEQLHQLPYMDMVLNETLRKYPPVPALQRESASDYVLPGGKVVNKGTLFVISVIGLHMDPKLFPNPEVFDPERFSKENVRNIAPYSYLPFGEGPRICIGMRFGKMQVKSALVALLSRFTVEPCEKTQIPIKIQKRTFAYNVDGGMWLRAKAR